MAKNEKNESPTVLVGHKMKQTTVAKVERFTKKHGLQKSVAYERLILAGLEALKGSK